MNLLPKDEAFFAQFEKQAELIVKAALLLQEAVDRDANDWDALLAQMHQFERKGDEITHETMRRLHRSFITPLDPEDIHSICLRLDDVLDMIDEVAARLRIYRITGVPQPMRDMTENLVASSHVIAEALNAVAHGREVSNLLVKVHDLEDAADEINHQALVTLFETEKDAIQLLKLKEIYEALEEAADSFEEVAHSLEGVVFKNA